jgi:hypothetical protein
MFSNYFYIYFSNVYLVAFLLSSGSYKLRKLTKISGSSGSNSGIVAIIVVVVSSR